MSNVKTDGPKYVSIVNGSNSTEPERMDGWVYEFPTFTVGDPQGAVEFLTSRADAPEHVASFLLDAWEAFCEVSRKAHHNGKNERGKDKPQRSETLTREQVEEFAAGLKLPAPKVKAADAISQARAEAKRAQEEKAAMQAEMLDLLADLPRAKAEARLAKLIQLGQLPEGTVLPA